MKITKLEHACVRLEKNGKVLVIDPGEFTPPESVADANTVLITHEHSDHFAADRIPSGADVWTNADLAGRVSGAHGVSEGDRFEAAGFTVAVRGKWHGITHPSAQLAHNVGFLIDDDIYHPGDSLTPPGTDVGTLLLPADAPWLRIFDAAQFLRTVRPERAFAVHDGLLNDRGLRVIDRWLEAESKTLGREVRRLSPGESASLTA